MTPLRAILVATLLATCAAQARASERGEIRFVSKQMGVAVEGAFARFTADVDFRPGDLAHSHANVDVDLASVDLASRESESELRKADWFDASRFPVATFRSTSLRSLGGDRYEVAGKLSIKGASRDVVVPVEIRKEASGGSMALAQFTLKRLAYGIGDGPWSDLSVVADDVVVRARIVIPVRP